MKISTLTTHQALELLGSESTKREADTLIRWLNESGYSDTAEIPDDVWSAVVSDIVSKCADAN